MPLGDAVTALPRADMVGCLDNDPRALEESKSFGSVAEQ